MKIAVVNFKGGMGKTTIALNIALSFDFGIVANETYTVLKNHLDENNLLICTKAIPKELDDVVYDFGGGITPYMAEVLRYSDVIIIPFVIEGANVEVTLEAIASVLTLNKNVILVPNKIKTTDPHYSILLDTLKDYGFDNLELSPIRSSTAMQNIYTEHKTISQMQSEGGLNGFNYRKITDDFNNLFKLINFYKGNK